MVGETVKDTIRKLVELQRIDVEIYDFKRQIKEKPLEIDDLRSAYEAKKTKYEQVQAKAKEQELAKKSKEVDLQAKEDAIKKADAQLMTLKTNKEYQAKLFEIENTKADKSIIEDDLIKLMDLTEKLTQELAQEKAKFAEEEQKYLVEKEKIDAAIAEMQDRASVFEAQKKEAATNIERDVLAVYERIVENREGLALVPVRDNACGGCFMNLPPQAINKIKMYEAIERCEMCARLLYIEEDL